MPDKKTCKRDDRVLRFIFSQERPTRKDIARLTGMSPKFITESLNRLLELGLVETSGKTQNRSGRPSTVYRLGEGIGYVIGVSVEETSFCMAAVDARHAVIHDRSLTLTLSDDPGRHLDDILEQVSSGIRLLMSGPELSNRKLLSVGIAPPGMVDTEKGVWLNGLQVSGITHVPLEERLRNAFGLPVVVEDVDRCLAYLAVQRLPRERTRDLVYLYLGSGVGAGLIAGHEPYRGTHGLSGEVGHLMVEEEGERCFCGNIGCLETVVSQPSILRRFSRRLSEGVISSLQRSRSEDGLTLEAIRAAAADGDRMARSTLFEIGAFLGDACATIITLYNPRTLVIGGPVAILGEHLREPVAAAIQRKVIPQMLEDFSLEMIPSVPQDEAVGVALLAERRFWSLADTPRPRAD
jgi:N-acetylglucosamine repressor